MNTQQQWWIGALSPAAQTKDTNTRVIDLGPHHPSRAGLVGVSVETARVDGDEVVTAARVQPGYLHRGAEKLFEARDYRQVLMLADRHDWQAPFSGELVAALACEQLLGLSAPPRAVWLRTLLAEQARITSHLGFLAWVAGVDAHVARDLRGVRERGRQLMLALSGNRLHPMLNRLGGVAADLTTPWLGALHGWCQAARSLPLAQALDGLDLPPGLGQVDESVVAAYGLSGPTARSRGMKRDLRRNPGYLNYAELEWPAIEASATAGDAHARFSQFIAEIEQGVALIDQCAQALAHTAGPTSVKLSKIVKLPEAETWVGIEAPLGIAGVHLVSRGGTTPWRLALRTPTFSQVNALHQVLVGTPTRLAPAVIASMGYTIGDLDK